MERELKVKTEDIVVVKRICEDFSLIVNGVNLCLYFFDVTMASNNVLLERQLLLLERMNKRVDLLLDGQRKLEEANASLQQGNAKLKSQLQGRPQSSRHASRYSRRDSSVEIPTDLSKLIAFTEKSFWSFSCKKMAVHLHHELCKL